MEEILSPKPGDFVRGALTRKRERNPSYSLRAMARDLGVSHTYLSLVINGRKGISPHQASWMGDALKMDAATKEHFVRSAAAGVASAPALPKRVVKFLTFDVESRKLPRDWHHFAIADLTLTSSFRPSPTWIGKRLGISARQAREALDRLRELGFLERTPDGWRKTQAFLQFSARRSTPALRRFHRTMISKALAALQSPRKADFERRDITGAMIAVNPEKLVEAKRKIASFRKQMIRLLGDGECTELYQLNVQLFPLSLPVDKARAEKRTEDA